MSEIEFVDMGWNAFEARLEELDSVFIKAGLPENGQIKNGNQKGSGHRKFGQIDELAEVMAIHEFGSRSGKIPERSFIRSSIDENLDVIADLKQELALGVIDNRISVNVALDRLGIKVVSIIRRKIETLSYPPNAKSTIRRKKSSNPLIDTGQARQSIQFVKMREL